MWILKFNPIKIFSRIKTKLIILATQPLTNGTNGTPNSAAPGIRITEKVEHKLEKHRRGSQLSGTSEEPHATIVTTTKTIVTHTGTVLDYFWELLLLT